ncbi:hypothetical protein SpCBS45565_g05875 [Spizellomyces sp. 'palustris']|nr:hypothetical protein SpCBS45565_g05875 [Spizellomyces sp. 'palustris']
MAANSNNGGKLALRKQLKKGFAQRLRSMSSPPPPLPINQSAPTSPTSSPASKAESPKLRPSSLIIPNGSQLYMLKRSASGPSTWGSMSRSRSPTKSANEVLSLADFRQADMRAKHQRRILVALEKRQRAPTPMLEKGTKSKGNLWEKHKKDRSDPKKGVLSKLLKPRKRKRSQHTTFHLLNIAVHDHRMSQACSLLDEISPTMLHKTWVAETEKIFLLAMANGMEPVCMLMLDKGYPPDVNAPVFSARCKSFQAPSYFMLALGLGLHTMVFRMIQNHRVKVNHSWYGLTALHIACCRGQVSMVRMLLEYGANPRKGLNIADYRLLVRLRNAQPKSTRTGLALPSTALSSSAPLPSSPLPAQRRLSRRKSTGQAAPPLETILPLDMAAMLHQQEVISFLLSRMKPSTLGAASLHLLKQANMNLGLE